jgi:hypothetical protein
MTEGRQQGWFQNWNDIFIIQNSMNLNEPDMHFTHLWAHGKMAKMVELDALVNLALKIIVSKGAKGIWNTESKGLIVLFPCNFLEINQQFLI